MEFDEKYLQEKYANFINEDYVDLYEETVGTLEELLEAEAVEAAKEEPNSDGNYKDGAESAAPAGHQWVYVFIVNAKEITTKVIQAFTKQPYNHSALSFDKSLTNMASFVATTFKRENIRNYKPEATFSLYKIAVPNETVIVMKDMVANIEKCKKDYKYSYLGLLGFIDKRHARLLNSDKKAMFCSQFVARMFASAGMKIFGDRPDYTIKPYDFAKNKNFKFCYRGNVKNYNPAKVR